MRRPGGVGSMGRSVHAPGPEKDYFNSWTKKHLPGLNLDSLPSMSVMGAEMARFGFGGSGTGGAGLGMNTSNSYAVDGSMTPPGIVVSPFADGGDVAALSRGGEGAASSSPGGANTGTGLDKAAAAIETWLRGAWARKPLTPATGPRGASSCSLEGEEGDLIELADANSDDVTGRGRDDTDNDDDGTGPARGRFGLVHSTAAYQDPNLVRPTMTYGSRSRADGEQNINNHGSGGSSATRGRSARLRRNDSPMWTKGDKGD